MTLIGRLFSVSIVAALLPSGVASAAPQSATDGTNADIIYLFDGKTLNGWKTVAGQPVTQGWEVVGGELHLATDGLRGGNIVTAHRYTNFELLFEWRVAVGGNNGVKYRVRDFDGKILGIEYQIIDDEHHGSALRPDQKTGAIYEVYEPNPNRFLRPAGEYNDSRIVVHNNRIEHWLNGQQIATATVGSDDWMERVANSKFADAEGFGQYRTGKIMLTDHRSEVWFRYIFLRPLQ